MQEPVEAEGVRTYTLVARRAQRSVLEAALLADHWRRPATWWRPLVIGLAGVALLVGGPVPGAAALGVGLAVAVALFLATYRRYARSVRSLLDRTWTEGSEHASTFGPDGMTFRGPEGATAYAWEEVADVRPGEEVVVVHVRRGRVRHLVPEALFPAWEIAAVQDRLAAPRG